MMVTVRAETGRAVAVRGSSYDGRRRVARAAATAEPGHAKVQDLVHLVTGVALVEQVAESDALADLARRGDLRRVGRGRSTRYVLP